MRLSVVMISSIMPSPKYSCSGMTSRSGLSRFDVRKGYRRKGVTAAQIEADALLMLVGSAEFAERQQRVRDATFCELAGEVIERDQLVQLHERLQLAVQRADDAFRVGALRLLRLDARRQLLRLVGDVVDRPRKILEDHRCYFSVLSARRSAFAVQEARFRSRIGIQRRRS
jgi:hypothetical protein